MTASHSEPAPNGSAHASNGNVSAADGANGIHRGPPEQPTLSPASPDWQLHLPASSVHPDDEKTKDNWIMR